MLRDKLASVKASIKIQDVLKRHGIPVPAGANTQISCPFHGDDVHPSARVYSDTNTIFCFTCRQLYDVVAVEMYLSGLSLPDAVDALAEDFSVVISESHQDIKRFYALATKYAHGDAEKADSTLLEMGSRFRALYMSIEEWRSIDITIDHFWREFDLLYKNSDLSPADVIDKALDWFSEAYAAVVSMRYQLHRSEAGVQETTDRFGENDENNEDESSED